MVALRKSGETYVHKIANIVLLAFRGPCPKGQVCCHLDGDSLNNRIENLRWDTQKSNARDSIAHGTFSKPPIFYGESHHNVTISDSDVLKIRSIPYYRGLFADMARKYNVAEITIGRIYKGLSRGAGDESAGIYQIIKNTRGPEHPQRAALSL
jgi:hypothetical protein